MARSIPRTASISISIPTAQGECRYGGCALTAASRKKSRRMTYNNWFPHLSPDGRYMVFLSYEKDVSGHPPNKEVTLRLMTLDSKKITVLAKFFGGQGTINVPCWSPDSKQIAFVTYQLIP